MPESYARPTRAEVSLGALRHNLRRARELVGARVAVMAVVKADGYGHGAAAVSAAFVAAGAAALGVSTVEEGIDLRRAGIAAPVVALGGAFPGEEPLVATHDLGVAVWSLDQARAIGAAARAAGRDVAVHVKIDTGMTRLGLDRDAVRAFGEALQQVPGLTVAGVFSHLASADAVDTASARAQVERFAAAVDVLATAGLRPALVHLANSAAVICEPAAHFTMVRPGIMLYGYPPAPHVAARAGVRPAMRLRSAAAQVRAVAAGTAVGYGGTWVAPRSSRVAVVPIGYADGYHRLASNRAQMVMRGRRVPIAGRVCMDHTMLDVTEVGDVRAGEPVTVFGDGLGADELAGWCDTIPYEMLTAVGRRVPRTYVEEFVDA